MLNCRVGSLPHQNLLRRHIKDESVDLVYLDPPFKSDQDYNILFAERNGSQAAAQIKAFEDTWHYRRFCPREVRCVSFPRRRESRTFSVRRHGGLPPYLAHGIAVGYSRTRPA